MEVPALVLRVWYGPNMKLHVILKDLQYLHGEHFLCTVFPYTVTLGTTSPKGQLRSAFKYYTNTGHESIYRGYYYDQ